ncbi:hypothetical protein [Roseobacter sp. CCS2]|uniref:hypothetical protein n=1 Tax=Roseobacter sp. CCS2 TaxID=391593 RepID=UPI0000F3E330|nr:hypothetical protein [Roseobacter sp. CCS2]EBA12270.1 hypothetical protein RCCS2_13274 [Roseobacter sp. CCS2]
MGRNWIIDVLADLRRFARDNDLPLLSAQLEEAGLVAEVEIASHPDTASPKQVGEYDPLLSVPGKMGLSRRT